jgi:hypothetical protein
MLVLTIGLIPSVEKQDLTEQINCWLVTVLSMVNILKDISAAVPRRNQGVLVATLRSVTPHPFSTKSKVLFSENYISLWHINGEPVLA